MFSKFPTRREFLNCVKLSLLFLLNSCSNISKKVNIALQNSFYPQSFKDTIPKDWEQQKINLERIGILDHADDIPEGENVPAVPTEGSRLEGRNKVYAIGRQGLRADFLDVLKIGPQT